MSKSFVFLSLVGVFLALQICVAQWSEIQSLRYRGPLASSILLLHRAASSTT